jgi:hypothetical protein
LRRVSRDVESNLPPEMVSPIELDALISALYVAGFEQQSLFTNDEVKICKIIVLNLHYIWRWDKND